MTLSQVMTIIIGEPVSEDQVSWALKKVALPDEEQEGQGQETFTNEEQEGQEEEMEEGWGAVGSIVISGNGRNLSRAASQEENRSWDPLEQDENGEDSHEKFRRLQRENNPAPAQKLRRARIKEQQN